MQHTNLRLWASSHTGSGLLEGVDRFVLKENTQWRKILEANSDSMLLTVQSKNNYVIVW
jgi:hypothetical protein